MKANLITVSNNRGLLRTYKAILDSVGRIAAKMAGTKAHFGHYIAVAATKCPAYKR